MDLVSALLAIVSIISIVECVGMFYSTKMARETVKNIPLMAKTSAIQMLKDPELKAELVSMFLDQEFMEATSKQIFESLKSGIYGLLGVDKKQEKAIGSAVLSDLGNLEGLAGLLPDKFLKGKVGKMITEHPEILQTLLSKFLPSLLAPGQQSSIPQGVPSDYGYGV